MNRWMNVVSGNQANCKTLGERWRKIEMEIDIKVAEMLQQFIQHTVHAYIHINR